MIDPHRFIAAIFSRHSNRKLISIISKQNQYYFFIDPPFGTIRMDNNARRSCLCICWHLSARLVCIKTVSTLRRQRSLGIIMFIQIILQINFTVGEIRVCCGLNATATTEKEQTNGKERRAAQHEQLLSKL